MAGLYDGTAKDKSDAGKVALCIKSPLRAMVEMNPRLFIERQAAAAQAAPRVLLLPFCKGRRRGAGFSPGPHTIPCPGSLFPVIYRPSSFRGVHSRRRLRVRRLHGGTRVGLTFCFPRSICNDLNAVRIWAFVFRGLAIVLGALHLIAGFEVQLSSRRGKGPGPQAVSRPAVAADFQTVRGSPATPPLSVPCDDNGEVAAQRELRYFQVQHGVYEPGLKQKTRPQVKCICTCM